MNGTALAATTSVLRTLLGVLSGYLIQKGYINADQATALVSNLITAGGAALAVGTALWGAIQKYRTEQATKARETAAVQSGVTAATVGAVPVSTPVSPAAAQAVIKQFSTTEATK